MERERAILRNVRDILRSVIIITALFIPCIVILVVKALLCVVKKFYAYVQRELELFDELYGDNKVPLWDKEGLFKAFIKGEDIHSLRQMKNILRPIAEKKRRAAIYTRVNSGLAMTSTMKRPMMLEQFIQDLVHQRPCAPLWVYADIAGESDPACDEGSQDCARIDASLSDSVTKDIVAGVNQLRKVNGNKDHSGQTSMCANDKVYCQATSHTQLNSNGGANLHYTQMAVHFQTSTEKQANVCQDIGRSALTVEKRKKKGKAAPSVDSFSHVGTGKNVTSQATERSTDKKVTSQTTERSTSNVNKAKKGDKTKSVVRFNQVGTDKKVSSQAIERSTSSVNKAKKRDKDASAGCSNQVAIDVSEKVTSQATVPSTPSVKKGKKRRKRKSVGSSNETTESEQSAKKQRKEPGEAKQKKKNSKKVARARAKVRQRKLMKVELQPGTHSNGQPVPTKRNQDSANAIPFGAPPSANTPSHMAANQEPTADQNVLGELVNAKRPLPVNPFTVQPAGDKNEGPLSATPYITELAGLMEKLQISSSVVPDVSHDSDSVDESDGDYELYDSEGDCVLCECDVLDDGDGEYDLFPELKSLPEQVLQLIQLLP